MSIHQALTLLLHHGANNTEELTKALQADLMQSPIANVRALKAITTALSAAAGGQDLDLSEPQRAQINELIAHLSESIPGRGRPVIEHPASEHIHLRATKKRKSHYVRTAKARGMTLAAWAFEALDAVSKFEGTDG